MLKKVVVLAICLLPMGLMAQNLKFGHVNSQEALKDLPQMLDAQEKLEKKASEYEAELTKQKEKYEAQMREFLDAKVQNGDPAIKQIKQQSLISLEQEITNIQEVAQEQLQREQAKLITPIIEDVKREIKLIGDEKGFIYIFDLSGTAIVYNSDQSEDITTLLKDRLVAKNKAAAPAAKPAATTPAKPAARK